MRRSSACYLVFLVFMTVVPSGGSIAEESTDSPESTELAASIPAGERLEELGATIGTIEIRVANVFDTEQLGEAHRLARVTNRLHRRTRERVVRQKLLFQSGEAYSENRIRETERILRKAGYFYDAKVTPQRFEDGTVDVLVWVRDVWTMRLGASLGRSGGTNSTSLSVGDRNLFGLGKDLQFKRSSSVDRSSSRLRYRDPSLFGSHWQLQTIATTSNDGETRAVSIGRPFYSLDSRWSLETEWLQEVRIDPLYDRGEIFDRFRHLEDHLELSAGFSAGRQGATTRRFRVGLTYQRDRFEALEATSGSLPENRLQVYPWLQIRSIGDRYIRTRNLDKIGRTEDLNLGAEWHARIGYASPSWGADRSQALFDAGYNSAFALGRRQLIFYSLSGEGRYRSGRAENFLAGGKLRYLARFGERSSLVIDLEADTASRLDADRQLLLGGDSGLRGYPLRFLQGDRRLLLRVEQRFYTNAHWFRMAKVGGAVFLDAGNAWFSRTRTEDPAGRNLFRNVGVGLRLGSSRSARASMVHVDLAVPLDAVGDIQQVQFLISTKEKF